MMTGLLAAVSGVHTIGGGQAAGLKFAPPRGTDRAMRLGTYETAIQQCIAAHLSPGGVFADVGANVGFFSLIAARLAGPAGQVYAFEPVERNAASIVRSCRLNAFATVAVFTEAVGARTGRENLMLARHIGGAMLASAGTPPDATGSVQVDIVSLDDAIALRNLRPPNFVKIDVEGAELAVLQGMQRTLKAVRPTVIYEVDDATRAGLEKRSREIAAMLNDAGYDLCPLPASYPNDGWQVEHVLARSRPC